MAEDDTAKWEPPADYVDQSPKMRLLGLVITVVIVVSFLITCFILYCDKWRQERLGRNKKAEAEDENDLDDQASEASNTPHN